jgi:photosystem I subunit 8
LCWSEAVAIFSEQGYIAFWSWESCHNVDMTQLTGSYAASWLPWITIPLIFYILPFPVFALIFIWIEKEAGTAEEEV